ncbi:epoxide hydrolase [Pyrenophora seminiperda CCB06]|uniref:Epoxide hydrolase n=1 Tax=Pyrenophora seminiperda CCB06 TaxID=1302712 RepID=A0A3M7LZ39_9PLEO|nr:epoxide hydrolase [Pyrenophora seminiperda CCB06]
MSYSPPASAKPFTLNVSDQDLSEWRQLLQLSKLAPETYETQQEDRRFGVTRKWLSEAKDYWLTKYDWRAEEKSINSIPNYKMQIESVQVHFAALFSENKGAIPILFMHGWPGSFVEFLPMLQLIKKKYSAKDLPYHIVVASLPGYPLSTIHPTEDWAIEDSGRILNQLMLTLGFNKYLVQGGDVGSFVAQTMNATYDGCVGMHCQTGEKFLEWSDEDPSLDAILTNASLYWFTESFTRSLHPYRTLFSGARPEIPKTNKPLGISWFAFEIFPILKSGVEKENSNLVFYKQHERGGHFAALERPNDLLDDVEAFVSKAWKV